MCTAVSFPELQLYLVTPESGKGRAEGVAASTSGRSLVDEYWRTIGALCGVFWLCRLALPDVQRSEHLDGQRGFCFGVSERMWRPPTAEQVRRPSLPRQHAPAMRW